MMYQIVGKQYFKLSCSLPSHASMPAGIPRVSICDISGRQCWCCWIWAAFHIHQTSRKAPRPVWGRPCCHRGSHTASRNASWLNKALWARISSYQIQPTPTGVDPTPSQRHVRQPGIVPSLRAVWCLFRWFIVHITHGNLLRVYDRCVSCVTLRCPLYLSFGLDLSHAHFTRFTVTVHLCVNPLTAGASYIRVFMFISTLSTTF